MWHWMKDNWLIMVHGDLLKPIYGSNPTSFHLFLRIKPGKMSH